MEFRKATRKDINEFTEIRMEFVTSIRNIKDTDAFRRKTRAYLEQHIDQDDLVIFIAIQDLKIVASCMACIFQTAPLPSCTTGNSSELLNVYTRREYRRQGIAEKLVRMTLQQLKKEGVGKVLLDYTDMGLPLYEKIGFTLLDRQMQFKL